MLITDLSAGVCIFGLDFFLEIKLSIFVTCNYTVSSIVVIIRNYFWLHK